MRPLIAPITKLLKMFGLFIGYHLEVCVRIGLLGEFFPVGWNHRPKIHIALESGFLVSNQYHRPSPQHPQIIAIIDT
jgi:hypothetical protein